MQGQTTLAFGGNGEASALFWRWWCSWAQWSQSKHTDQCSHKDSEADEAAWVGYSDCLSRCPTTHRWFSTNCRLGVALLVRRGCGLGKIPCPEAIPGLATCLEHPMAHSSPGLSFKAGLFGEGDKMWQVHIDPDHHPEGSGLEKEAQHSRIALQRRAILAAQTVLRWIEDGPVLHAVWT